MSKKEKWEGDLQRVGKMESPQGNPRREDKDKEKDEERKKSFARISEGANEAGGFREGWLEVRAV